MADNGSRRGAVEMGTVLMVVAFAIIGGFMYWLSTAAAAERAEAEIVEDTTPVDTGADVTVVSGEDIQMDATPYEGQEIRLANHNVASALGSQGFWLEMPNGNPFLVSMSAEVMAEGLAISGGQAATVTGVVYAMNDSTLTAWTEAATIAEGDRIVAEFATHYLEAASVQLSGGGGGGGGMDDGGSGG